MPHLSVQAIRPSAERAVRREACRLPLETIDPLRDPRWAELVEGGEAASIFHHPSWLGLLREQYKYEVSAVCVAADDGRLLAGLPLASVRSALTGKRFVSLPFSDLCPVIGDPDARSEVARGLEQLEADSGRPIFVHAAVEGVRSAHTGPCYLHHVVPLSSDPEAVAARYSKSQVKRGIKKALREGLTVERRTDSKALESFYRLHLETRRRQGVPTQPKRFIARLASLFNEGLGFVAVAHDADGEIAATAVFLTYRDEVVYKYGASDRASLPKRPNNLLFDEVIRWACEKGYRWLDLGRTDLENEGLRSFKAAWGAEERSLAYTTIGDPATSPSGAGSPSTRWLIRHSPPFVGRLVGETLYKHFA